MLGRGIDQIMLHSSDPTLHEPYVKDANEYVRLAEITSGPIARPVPLAYVWGDAIDVLRHANPALRIINLETSITTSDAYLRDKCIHYRMHPKNIGILTEAGIDCCVLANNHVLDWGRQGLVETLEALESAGISVAGAGFDAEQAAMPAVLAAAGGRRVLVFSVAQCNCGAPPSWSAGKNIPGINLVSRLDAGAVRQVADQIRRHAREEDIVVLSVHWGDNWGWSIPDEQIVFAHQLIDEAGVDLVHGHSSHHAKGIELYRDRLILYGCGDLLNDYEGIGGHEPYRPDLALMYFPQLDASTGKLIGLRLTPMQITRLRLRRASDADTIWLRETLNCQSPSFSVRLRCCDGDLVIP